MSNKPPSHIDLSARTLELTAFTRRLRKEYVELIEVSAVPRRVDQRFQTAARDEQQDDLSSNVKRFRLFL
jgi:hypothetical protein